LKTKLAAFWDSELQTARRQSYLVEMNIMLVIKLLSRSFVTTLIAKKRLEDSNLNCIDIIKAETSITS